MHKDKEPVPDTFLNKRARNLGAEAPDVDIMSYFEFGAARRVASIPLDNSLDKLMVTCKPFSLAGLTGFKAADLHMRACQSLLRRTTVVIFPSEVLIRVC